MENPNHCKYCNYTAPNKNSFKTHLSTKKHIKNAENTSESAPPTAPESAPPTAPESAPPTTPQPSNESNAPSNQTHPPENDNFPEKEFAALFGYSCCYTDPYVKILFKTFLEKIKTEYRKKVLQDATKLACSINADLIKNMHERTILVVSDIKKQDLIDILKYQKYLFENIPGFAVEDHINNAVALNMLRKCGQLPDKDKDGNPMPDPTPENYHVIYGVRYDE